MSAWDSPEPIAGLSDDNARSSRAVRQQRGRRWPSWVLIALSIAGILVAIVAWTTVVAQTRMLIAICGFVVVVIGGTVMLFVQRVLDVAVARKSGRPLSPGVGAGDKLAFVLLLIASVSNGVVIALQVARQ